MWQCQVREVFKREKVLSIQVDYYTYGTGAAHGHTATVGLNFAGEEVGKFEIAEIFNRDVSSLKFIIDYVPLGLGSQFFAMSETQLSL